MNRKPIKSNNKRNSVFTDRVNLEWYLRNDPNSKAVGPLLSKHNNKFRLTTDFDKPNPIYFGTKRTTTTHINNVSYFLKNDYIEKMHLDYDYRKVLQYARSKAYTLPSIEYINRGNRLVLDLKAADLWDKIDVFYMFHTDGDYKFSLINWKNPSKNYPIIVNSPEFTSLSGWQGDGMTSYLDTNYNPVTNIPAFNIDSNYFGFVLNNTEDDIVAGLDNSTDFTINFLSNDNGVRIYTNDTIITPPSKEVDEYYFVRKRDSIIEFGLGVTIRTNITTNLPNFNQDKGNILLFKSANNYSSLSLSTFFIGNILGNFLNFTFNTLLKKYRDDSFNS